MSGGSSPHLRGARGAQLLQSPPHGIIPASAGSTPNLVVQRCEVRDHPRVCGEHGESPDFMEGLEGSSPRLRGALVVPEHDAVGDGIIPASAGSTRPRSRASRASQDHPRVCGEHSGTPDSMPRAKGSSPRLRGAPMRRRRAAMPGGIIPASAGSTDYRNGLRRLLRDHPRVCGEHALSVSGMTAQQGSSPRLRGARCVR